ncbi:MAG: TetR/AcrR family transcriptional regulator [Blautia sp.]|nr:TetR/AcrR family transcriptional regulator [Blautia sp.]MDY5032853.1 TetR/AcrR family transcriptional regulator [Blautia sp.]
MEDKRIKKTKKNLKQTMIRLLKDTPFEKITVTQLCRESDTSRITFYTHYNDKYALIDDIFADLQAAGDRRYRLLQKKNNPEYVPAISYSNILNSILDVYYDNMEFLQYASPEVNPYLAFRFYDIVLKTVEGHTTKEGSLHNLKYSPRQISGFLCYGFTGFINESTQENLSQQEIRRQASRLLAQILRSDILVE